MVSKGYLWTLRIIAVLSLGALSYVVLKIDPDRGWLSRVYFFAALFLFLSSFFNLVLLWLRKRTLHGEMLEHNLLVSLRQGFLLAILAVSILLLQGLRMLVWWDGLLIVAGIFLIELYFLSGRGEEEC
jgi:hypothetical protein